MTPGMMVRAVWWYGCAQARAQAYARAYAIVVDRDPPVPPAQPIPHLR